MDRLKTKYRHQITHQFVEEHQLAAIMFTDIVGYTKLMAEDEEKALHLLDRNRDIQKTIIELHHGQLIKEIGDGILASFKSSNDSVLCAKEIIKAVQAESELSLRIGIHEGDSVFKGNDVFGDGVNIASRIQEQAGKDTIFISESVYNDIRNKPGINVEFIEEKTLKNIGHPIKIYSVINERRQTMTQNILSQKPTDHTHKSIVVLPFQNISSEPAQEYFSDGLTDEIITDLTQIRDFNVISRSTSIILKHTNKSFKTIAEEVNVQYVLEGSVRKSGNNLRITTKLIDTENDKYIWAEKYSGTLDDIFDIQEKVSRSITKALKIKLNVEEEERLIERPISNVQALECCFKARSEMLKLTEEGFDRALDELQHGLNIVDDNTILYEEMGLTYVYSFESGTINDKNILRKAEECANKVLQKNPNSSSCYFVLGYVNRFFGNTVEAISQFKKALEINPFRLDALLFLSRMYTLQVGKYFDAQPLISKALEMDPLTPINHVFLGLNQLMAQDVERALRSFQKTDELKPGLIYAKFWCIYCFVWMGEHERAIELIDQIIMLQSNLKSDKLLIQWCLFFKYVLKGEKRKAIETLSDDVKTYFWDHPELTWLGAGNFALIDEKSEAIEWLENATNRGWINYPLFAKDDPLLRNIRSESRFKTLMKKIKFDWESFKL